MEVNRQGAKNAKQKFNIRLLVSFEPWRPGG
jgi:hypothetical protein